MGERLSPARTRAAGLAFGGLLLAAYGLGHCALVIGAGTSVGFVGRVLSARGVSAAAGGMRAAGGVLAVGAGLYLLFVA